MGGTAVPALAAAGDPDQAFVELVERHRETMQAWCRLGEAIDKAMKAIRVYAPRVQYGHRRSHGERTPLYAHTVDELKRAIGPWHQGLPAISAEDHRRRNARRNGLIAELHRRKTVYEAKAEAVGLRQLEHDQDALWQAAKGIEAEIRDRPAAGFLGIAAKVRFFLEHYADGSEARGWRWETATWSPAEQILANAHADAARLAGRATS